ITQRLIAALSAPTAEGVLYEVDMRLRPSGNKGPVATRITSFAKYQTEEAWTWEHMALTRARVLCGDESLMKEADDIFRAVLRRKREPAKIAKDVAEMRSLIDQEKPPKDVWDLKLIPGGLIDIEFIAQFLALLAPARGVPQPKRAMPTGEALAVLGGAMMDPNDLETVQKALSLYTEISQIVRLCVDGGFDPKEAPAGLIDLVCRAGDSPDIRALEADLKQRAKAVRKIFQALVAKS
ncbi:MAG: bifunctional [glutamine synthetase] adenylyltransferase/[glutamine synthetase]-adenylyl-L-tyrosine phosphorylase, partial [Shinella sp.]